MVLENLVLFFVVMSADLAAWWVKDKFLIKKPKKRRKKRVKRKRRALAPVLPITGSD